MSFPPQNLQNFQGFGNSMNHLNYAPRGPYQPLPAEYWQNMSHPYFTPPVVHGYDTPHTTGMSFTPSMSNEPATPTFVPETQLSHHESPIEVVNLEKTVSNAESTRKCSSWTKLKTRPPNCHPRIVNALENHSAFFQQRDDAVRRNELSPLQKCTAAIRQLAYGVPVDHLDEYLRMGESTVIRYLRRPNADDVQRHLQMHDERHDFLGMLGNMSEINFTVNDTAYTKGYYLTDGIYPKWVTFVKAFPCPEDPKRKLFKERQESARKDVEPAFRGAPISMGNCQRSSSVECSQMAGMTKK
ncbi:uncharacterized protein LOC121987967 [Zingiber officinale]|uniref:uncharacterized protein LOC121987967 n=1 Tax=Zingiber officinale TaxID=94328 RepID=UPI001C4ABEB4|nr:uncharacterized protein LOC121987967 [Zingiber officinale]